MLQPKFCLGVRIHVRSQFVRLFFYCYLLSRNVNSLEYAVKIPDLYRLVADKLRFWELVIRNSVIVK